MNDNLKQRKDWKEVDDLAKTIDGFIKVIKVGKLFIFIVLSIDNCQKNLLLL